MKNPLTTCSCLLCVFLMLAGQLFLGIHREPQMVIQSDVADYYAYLPAIFIYRDMSLAYTDHAGSGAASAFNRFALEDGGYVLKMSMGMSLLYAPFFLIAHLIASGFDSIPADGYSYPYALLLGFSGSVYFIAGLVVLAKNLLSKFSDAVVAMVLVLLTLGTNFTYYLLREPAMSHSYSFCLFAFFIFFTSQWHRHPRRVWTLCLALTYGLITLVRPTNGVIAVCFIFWGIESAADLKTRAVLFWKKKTQILAIALVSASVWIPQFVYWYRVTGSCLHYSYQDEGFFFSAPKILSVLLSFRKGWLIYTPAMILALLGFFPMYKLYRKYFWAVLSFFLLNLYVVSSWWCWWYGGSFGQRALIESYVLLAFPLAAFITALVQYSRGGAVLAAGLICAGILHNGFQLLKLNNGAIHMENMTRSAYLVSLGKWRPTPEYYSELRIPDFESARRGLPESEWKTDR